MSRVSFVAFVLYLGPLLNLGRVEGFYRTEGGTRVTLVGA